MEFLSSSGQFLLRLELRLTTRFLDWPESVADNLFVGPFGGDGLGEASFDLLPVGTLETEGLGEASFDLLPVGPFSGDGLGEFSLDLLPASPLTGDGLGEASFDLLPMDPSLFSLVSHVLLTLRAGEDSFDGGSLLVFFNWCLVLE